MSGITRYTPASHLLANRFFGPGFSRVFDEFFTPGGAGEEDVSLTNWTPAADVKETDTAVFIYVELPGLLKEDVDVSLEAGVLTVSGERRFVKDDTKESYRRLERFYGKFSRSFRLPRTVEAGKVKATFADGLLALELPKSEVARPRQIEIN